MKIPKQRIQVFFSTLFNSYSQVFFSESRLFAVVLILVSFLDYRAGVSGFVAVLVSNVTAYVLGFNRHSIKQGAYGFNALMVGLGIGVYFQFSAVLFITIIFAAIFTLFITLALEGILAKYALPYLSMPFLIGIWSVTLATRDFTALGLSESGIYTYNELYALGGTNFIFIYDWVNALEGFDSLKIYFLSLGAIFFQNKLLAGIFISLGLLYYSRIAFSLSLIGFYLAYFFYSFIGADFSELAYTFIGFNYILSAIAIGGYFIIPSARSYLWTVLLLPVTVIVTTSLGHVFSIWQLSIYSLPFNVVVLLFLYILKLRYTKTETLSSHFVRQATPEKSLYLNRTAASELKGKNFFPVGLPFWGQWTVTQAHSGEYTHKGNWRHAWDFVITDENGEQFKNSGDVAQDYFCYEKLVLSPASGYVSDIYDQVEDNLIGDINTAQNWGNSIVIKHSDYLYSQLSHLKAGSFKVKKGDYVKKGQLLAVVGNSGHSPYPHLHFQLQATPYIGSQTLDYPLHNYIHKHEGKFHLKTFGKPQEGQQIFPAETDEILKNAFHFIPGKKMLVHFCENEITQLFEWEVYKTVANQTYIYCAASQSTAYFFATESGFYFTNFVGSKKSPLFFFFSSLYQVEVAYYQGITKKAVLRPNLFFSRSVIFFHDFIAPFIFLIKSKYSITYLEKDDDFVPDFVNLQSKIENRIFSKKTGEIKAEIHVRANQKIDIQIQNKTKKWSLKIEPVKRF